MRSKCHSTSQPYILSYYINIPMPGSYNNAEMCYPMLNSELEQVCTNVVHNGHGLIWAHNPSLSSARELHPSHHTCMPMYQLSPLHNYLSHHQPHSTACLSYCLHLFQHILHPSG